MCVLKPLKNVYAYWALYSRCQNKQTSRFWRIACLRSSHKPDSVCVLLLRSHIRHILSRRRDLRRDATRRFLIGYDTRYVSCFVKVSESSSHSKSQLPIRFLDLYYSPSSRGCARQSKRASKGRPKETSVVLLIIIATLLIPNLR